MERSNWCKVYKNATFYGCPTTQKAPPYCKFPNVKGRKDIDKDERQYVRECAKEQIREIKNHIKDFGLTINDILGNK